MPHCPDGMPFANGHIAICHHAIGHIVAYHSRTVRKCKIENGIGKNGICHNGKMATDLCLSDMCPLVLTTPKLVQSN